MGGGPAAINGPVHRITRTKKSPARGDMFLAPARETLKAPSGATCSVLVSPLRGLVAVGLSGTINRALLTELRWPAILIEQESEFHLKLYRWNRRHPSPCPLPQGERRFRSSRPACCAHQTVTRFRVVVCFLSPWGRGLR